MRQTEKLWQLSVLKMVENFIKVGVSYSFVDLIFALVLAECFVRIVIVGCLVELVGSFQFILAALYLSHIFLVWNIQRTMLWQ